MEMNSSRMRKEMAHALVTRTPCQRRHCSLVPPHLCAQPVPVLVEPVPPGQTIPRCIASHTAVLSRTPSRSAAPQWTIQAAMPSPVPEA